MSFLQNLYTKFIPASGSKRTNYYFDNKCESPVFEDFDNEDGFVVYTEKDTAAVNRQTYAQERLESNNIQGASAPGDYSPSGSSLLRSPEMNISSRGPKQPSSTLLTASDIPLKLCKPLEIINNSRRSVCNLNPRPLDIGEFFYDFHLEKTVLSFCEGDSQEQMMET